MRTEQDKINRREANRRYYNLEENKEQKREYMRKYNKRNKQTSILIMNNGQKKMVTETMIHLILKILLALKMAPKDKDLQKIYNQVFSDAMRIRRSI